MDSKACKRWHRPCLSIAMKKSFITVLAFMVLGPNANAGGICHDLPLNESIRVNHSFLGSKTIHQKYTLVRSEEKTYDVYLNLKFKPSKGFKKEMALSFGGLDDQTINGILNKFYPEKMESCFREYESSLADELGRKIRLHIYNEAVHKTIVKPPQVRISIKDSEFRSHSKAYNMSSDCPTLIHEALHLLGLVDEYVEKWQGFSHKFSSLILRPLRPVNENVLPAFDCRAIGPDNSAMANPSAVQYTRSLFSGHINAVIYPNCVKKNEKYFGCAKFWAKTSHKNNGAIPNISDCTEKVPDYCKDESWVMIDELDSK
ncbi:hypothetical protein ACJVC5_19655 [Peredibacter sp. HCB2-198]|uniref:hypothetical protein n=1 Tax=Peredibacter sp. HCB2-198 TaxID=3383025 RepID=UPI0038B55325